MKEIIEKLEKLIERTPTSELRTELTEINILLHQESNQVEPPVSDDFGDKELQPKKGAIAFCSLNRLGLITSETPIEVTYNDGNKGISWVGIQLTDGEVNGIGGDKGKIIKQKVGDPWMARKPKVIAYLDDIVSQNSR